MFSTVLDSPFWPGVPFNSTVLLPTSLPSTVTSDFKVPLPLAAYSNVYEPSASASLNSTLPSLIGRSLLTAPFKVAFVTVTP